MRIGLTTVYSWRPHVVQMEFLARLLEKAGNEVRFLTCDADLPTCYTRELRSGRPSAVECGLCRLGGVRSYRSSNVSSIKQLHSSPQPLYDDAIFWAQSSASTIGRFESDDDYNSPEFQTISGRLGEATSLAYDAALRWIDNEQLDAVVCFNGRMDVTRAVWEAARKRNVRYISMERTWFGDGIQLLPDENCLGLKSVHRMVRQWADVPLTSSQSYVSAGIVAARFTRSNTKEWRAYNVSAKVGTWPANGEKRVLFVPGSRNEIWGHPDRTEKWASRTAAFDAVIEHLGLNAEDIVVRGHPNWGERIGRQLGEKSERYYKDWANARNYVYLNSNDSTSTLSLIEQADAIVVAGGSAALEAGLIGKRVINLAPAPYQEAGFVDQVNSPRDLTGLDLLYEDSSKQQDVRRSKALRFCYTVARRIPQYCQDVICISPEEYVFNTQAAPDRLVNLLRTGELQPDDCTAAADGKEEEQVLQLVRQKRWDALLLHANAPTIESWGPIKRRPPFAMMDQLRKKLPRGDK